MSGFHGRNILDSERFRELDRRQSYYDCTQHDFKRFDFDGRMVQSTGGISATQPLMSAEKAAWYVPLRARRPSTPYRLARVIVNAFTGLLFGENQFPKFLVAGDADSEDYIKALIQSSSLASKMIRARNIGGATGTSALSWCYLDGKPRVQVHNPKYLYVHEWEDREELIPSHVTECFIYPRDEYDSQRKKLVRNYYWYRRDWTKDSDIVFVNKLVEPGKDPRWEPDVKKSVTHGDRLCHLNWIQNLPNDEIDGVADYDGLYESFDTIDLILSVITRGATLNLDPTLVLKLDPDLVQRMGVKKGSDNALVVGESGNAEYLELGGQSIEAGLKLFNEKRKAILEVAQCVIPDPDSVAAQGTSSVAMKMMYAPMIGKAMLHREQYGTAAARILSSLLTIAQHSSKNTVIVYDEDGNETEEEQEIVLPPRVTRIPKTDGDGLPTGEDDVKVEERDPGHGTDVDPQWGPWFPSTPQDQQLIATTLSTATNKATFMSPQMASEIMSAAFGRDASDEWVRLQKAGAAQDEKHKSMFADAGVDSGGQIKHTAPTMAGGSVTHTLTTPPADSSSMPTDSDTSSGSAAIAPTDLAMILTVNEARASVGLPKIEHADGMLTVTAYKAKYAAQIAEAANAELGKVGDPAPANPPPPPAPIIGGHPGLPGIPPGFPPKPGGGFPPKAQGGFPPNPGAPPSVPPKAGDVPPAIQGAPPPPKKPRPF